MNTLTKITCRTIGTVGIGLALYNSTRICNQFARNKAIVAQEKYLSKAYFDSRTIDSVNFNKNNIRKKTFDLRTKNPLPALWGKITGGVNGFLYGLGDNLPLIASGALAILGKNIAAKIGAAGVGLGTCYIILREGFGLGKQHPMN